MNTKPSIGRIVHVVIGVCGSLVKRPAIITRTRGDDTTAVQATVFPDGCNDMLGETLAKSSLQYDETGQLENSWHWPPVPASGIKVCGPKGESEPLEARLSSTKQIDWIGLYAQAIDLCVMVERLPASGEATNLSIQASCLLAAIREAAKPSN